jgi:hypothetical protein
MEKSKSTAKQLIFLGILELFGAFFLQFLKRQTAMPGTEYSQGDFYFLLLLASVTICYGVSRLRSAVMVRHVVVQNSTKLGDDPIAAQGSH